MARWLTSPVAQALVRAIIDARKAKGWTQQDLARKLSMSQQALASLEVGQRRLDVAEFVTLARVLEVNEVDLFSRVVESARDM